MSTDKPHQQQILLIDDIPGNVTISMGVCTMIPDRQSSFDGLLEVADKALYEAKEQGRKRIVFGTGSSGRNVR